MSEWTKINWGDTDVKYDWWDCTIGIYCPCNPHELIVLTEEGEEVCNKCKRKYHLVVAVEVQEP